MGILVVGIIGLFWLIKVRSNCPTPDKLSDHFVFLRGLTVTGGPFSASIIALVANSVNSFLNPPAHAHFPNFSVFPFMPPLKIIGAFLFYGTFLAQIGANNHFFMSV